MEEQETSDYCSIYDEVEVHSCFGCEEAVWLRKFIIEFGVFPSPVVLFCDNTGAIANTKDPKAHSVAKHIPRRYHVIRDYVRDKEVKVCKIHTDLNVANPLTKPLPQAKHDEHQKSTGFVALPNVNQFICNLV